MDRHIDHSNEQAVTVGHTKIVEIRWRCPKCYTNNYLTERDMKYGEAFDVCSTCGQTVLVK